MRLQELIVTLEGPIWSVRNFEIEGVDVIDRVEVARDAQSASVTVKDLPVSPDNVLNIFISLGAPNGSRYQVKVNGRTDDNPSRTIAFNVPDLVVRRNGKLVILIEQAI